MLQRKGRAAVAARQPQRAERCAQRHAHAVLVCAYGEHVMGAKKATYVRWMRDDPQNGGRNAV